MCVCTRSGSGNEPGVEVRTVVGLLFTLKRTDIGRCCGRDHSQDALQSLVAGILTLIQQTFTLNGTTDKLVALRIRRLGDLVNRMRRSQSGALTTAERGSAARV